MGNCDDEIDQEINCVIDQILQEDRLESMSLNLCPNPCDQTTEVIVSKTLSKKLLQKNPLRYISFKGALLFNQGNRNR